MHNRPRSSSPCPYPTSAGYPDSYFSSPTPVRAPRPIGLEAFQQLSLYPSTNFGHSPNPNFYQPQSSISMSGPPPSSPYPQLPVGMPSVPYGAPAGQIPNPSYGGAPAGQMPYPGYGGVSTGQMPYPGYGGTPAGNPGGLGGAPPAYGNVASPYGNVNPHVPPQAPYGNPAPRGPSVPQCKLPAFAMSRNSETGLFSHTDAELSSIVELRIAARNLVDRDKLSKSDPVCVIYYRDPYTNAYIEMGRTEKVMNDLSPDWRTTALIEYHFEERQMLKFSVYDYDAETENLQEHDYLGSLECSLGEIVAAPNQKFVRDLTLPFKYQNKSSQLIILSEETSQHKEMMHLKMCGKDLDKKDFFGKSDPYLSVFKSLDDGSWGLVYKSEVQKHTLNPVWSSFKLRVHSLTKGNSERPVKFEVWDWNSDGSNDFIGEHVTTVSRVQEACQNLETAAFLLINAKKKLKKKNYTDSGVLKVQKFSMKQEMSFLDYIKSGVQLHFTVAIDFTASNGDPNHPQSLHYRSPSGDNQYTLAIKAVGEIIQDYDYDKAFPALGFGALVPHISSNQASHDFPLNGDPNNPFCMQVEGILQAYYRSLNTVRLHGPTYFSPVIKHVGRFAQGHNDGKNYCVLLIITDGIICDMEKTIQSIIEVSSLPMSIIIVGVGEEDFSAMEELDSDGKRLEQGKHKAARDIVQFVELRRFMKLGPTGHPPTYSKEELAKSVLAELPTQLVDWMGKNRTSPS